MPSPNNFLRSTSKHWVYEIQVALFLFFVSAHASFGATPSNSPEADSSLPVQTIIRNIRKAPARSPEWRSWHQALMAHKISDPRELSALAEATKDKELASSALRAIERLDSTANPAVMAKAVELIDATDDSEEFRLIGAILKVNVKNRYPGAIERIRKRLDREPKTKMRTQDDFNAAVSSSKLRHRAGLIYTLAQALADAGDLDSIETIFSLDEVLAGPGASGVVAGFGKDAVIYAASRYPKEDGLRKRGCLQIIAMTRSTDSIVGLMTIASAADPALRINAIKALVRMQAVGVEKILETAQKDSDEGVRNYAQLELLRANPTKHMKEIEEALFGSDPTKQLHMLEVISRTPPKGGEALLERFIKDDEALNPRQPYRRSYAAEGLWRLTGKKHEYSRGAYTMTPYPWDDPTNK